MTQFRNLIFLCAAGALVAGSIVATTALAADPESEHAALADRCTEAGQWIAPDTGDRRSQDQVISDAARRAVVLLGETHDVAEHHRWQLSTIAALHGRTPNMALGFEAFPRRVQPVLDRWVAGELSTEAFLREVNWREVWGFDPELYLPLFHFARMHRIPMVALNVDRALVSRVGKEGWQAIPPEERMGVGDPAPASDAYRQVLLESYQQHLDLARARGESEGAEPPDPAKIQGSPAFARFVEAQLTWDRAMAEAVAAARNEPDSPLVVGIVGSGHLGFRHGVPHQLEDLGLQDAAVLLPMDLVEDCTKAEPGVADYAFALMPRGEAAPPPRPRLGVMIETAAEGIRVSSVVDDSVAEAADVRAGDVIIEAAGTRVGSTREMIEIVQRQAPGTWLPLKIDREGTPMEIVAKFPSNPHAAP